MITLTFGLLPLLMAAQLQNADFEQWQESVNSELIMSNKPTGWMCDNAVGFEIEETFFYNPPATPAQSGDYALTLSVWYHYAKDMAKQTAPVTAKPLIFKGFYKYTDNVLKNNANEDIEDTAMVSVYATKWNEATIQRDTIGTGQIELTAAFAFTEFQCPITYTGNEQPDEVIVLLDCSKVKRNGIDGIMKEEPVGSFFTVDNVSFENATLGSDDFTATAARVYPNPATRILNIANISGEAQLFDMTGKLVLSESITEGKTLDVSSLNTGIYTLSIKGEKQTHYTKVVKQ